MIRTLPRDRGDRCPGVLRPWLADDGALVRLRLVGGRTTRSALLALVSLAETFGDGRVHLTRRANLQLRGLPHRDGCVPASFADAVAAAGFLPAPSHELVRNIMISPLSGLSGGRADLRPVADALDAALCAEAALAALPGRFLFCLDDGRGDIIDRDLDLGLVAIDDRRAQVRIGSRAWGEVVDLDAAPATLTGLASAFLAARGTGPRAAWHIDELPDPRALTQPAEREDRTRVSAPPPPYGTIVTDDGRTGEHIALPHGTLTAELIRRLPGEQIVVTPWRGVVAVDPENA